MPLEGLRAWIGEVERKLGMRTRVFLVLSVIALGGAGAAIYLAVDARESSVSEGDVRALQEELEAKIAADSAGTTPPPEEPAVPESGGTGPTSPTGSTGTTGSTGGAGAGGATGSASGSGAAAPKSERKAKALELIEGAQGQSGN